MNPHRTKELALFVLAVSTIGATAQTPAQTGPPTRERAPLVVPHPHYVSFKVSIDVDAPIDKVWKRVGGFCDIVEWMNSPAWKPCEYLQGSGDFGSVRSVADEVEVGRTQYSYTYAGPPRVNTPYNIAHGTLAAEALTPITTRLTWSAVKDDSILPDDAARQRDLDGRKASINAWLKNMKTLAEGGTLPPKPAGSLRPANPVPFLNPNPHYEYLTMQIEANAPIDKVWARVGKTCDIGEWGFESCEIVSGTPGELGLVRTIGNSIIVAQAKYSYTYTQPLRQGGSYNMYHGTIEARSLGADKTELYYTLVWDDSRQPDDASRARQRENYNVLFSKMLRNMKKLSEGGTLTAEDKKSPSTRPATATQ